MLTPHLRSQFVTKILTSATGEHFRVVFLVALVNGEVKARMISAEPIAQTGAKSKAQAATPLCLPVSKSHENFVTFTRSPKGTSPSPYFNSLFFFNSQPTRAPSFA
jgi:hypothetical protein